MLDLSSGGCQFRGRSKDGVRTMTIGDMIALIMLYAKNNNSILNTSVDEIECTYDEICIYPTGGSSIDISRSEYLKEEEE